MLEVALNEMVIQKRGQIDKGLSALPIFFLVLVIVGVFAASKGFLLLTKKSDHIASYAPIDMPVLFDFVNVGSSEEKITVLEYFNRTKGEAALFQPEVWENFQEEVLTLAPNEGCLAFMWQGLPGDPSRVNGFFASRTSQGLEVLSARDNYSSFMDKYWQYDKRKALESRKIIFSSDNAQYLFMTYKGECLNE